MSWHALDATAALTLQGRAELLYTSAAWHLYTFQEIRCTRSLARMTARLENRRQDKSPHLGHLLVDVCKNKLCALVIVDVHLLGDNAVAQIIQGQEEAVHLHEPLALDQMRWHSNRLGSLCMQLKGQLPRQVLAAQNLGVEELPLEALDVELEDVHGVVAQQTHRFRQRPEAESIGAATPQVVVAAVELGASLANAPIVESEGLARHDRACRVHSAVEGVRLASLPGHLLLKVRLPSDAHAVDHAALLALAQKLQAPH